jgi:hypothetical protein
MDDSPGIEISQTPDNVEEPESPRISDAGAVKKDHQLSIDNHFKHWVEICAESLPVTIVMSLFTIWALFSDDIRLAATRKDADEGFMVVISIAFFLFFTEILAASYYKAGYLNLPSMTPVPGETFGAKMSRLCNVGSFYFWLDLIATVSLVFEVRICELTTRSQLIMGPRFTG